ncbi:fimbrial biogenesis chaperone [Shewanella fidelis]|uniref:Molecular chaperone n=1 Tax=Shewanella fidelis TaxID=173509 RepID=A0AAW8NPL8_9GAMM|nr:molecular chaperone [Shewanella fidelis]MDR8523824.1 molecular chaperone [Shewanella fidelis]MDW4810372.1 molecular chaperone [Shewanella fidelis]MDW4814517.1 molecular chaperone [Shewanella fidelis]MDW4818607.1 molecular chaperone [Shewanella fidelis]MDW4823740.1 molecular chaperone [Shewanella fidelis]
MSKLSLFAAKLGGQQYGYIVLILVLLSACFPQPLLAGVGLDKSRFVYIVGTKNAQFRLVNHNAYPVIVSLWLDSGDMSATPESTTAPLIVSPPIMQLNAKEVTTAKLIDAGITERLPDDRESLLWLNVLEQPPLEKQTSAEQVMAIAMQVQYKVFVRPTSIKPNNDAAFKQITFLLVTRKQAAPILQLHNPTAYHLSLKQLQLLGSCGQKIVINNVLKPYSEKAISLDADIQASCVETVEYRVINDEGKTIVMNAPVNIGTVVISEQGG